MAVLEELVVVNHKVIVELKSGIFVESLEVVVVKIELEVLVVVSKTNPTLPL